MLTKLLLLIISRVSWASETKFPLFVSFPDASILTVNVPRNVTLSRLYKKVAERLKEQTSTNTNDSSMQLHFRGKLLSDSKLQTVSESGLSDQAMIHIRLVPKSPVITASEPRLQLFARLPSGAVVAVEVETWASLNDLYDAIIKNNERILFEDTGDYETSDFAIQVQFQGEILPKSDLDEVGHVGVSAEAEIEAVLISKPFDNEYIIEITIDYEPGLSEITDPEVYKIERVGFGQIYTHIPAQLRNIEFEIRSHQGEQLNQDEGPSYDEELKEILDGLFDVSQYEYEYQEVMTPLPRKLYGYYCKKFEWKLKIKKKKEERVMSESDSL